MHSRQGSRGPPAPESTYAELLEQPNETEEIWNMVLAGQNHRAPGSDGTGLEFYKVNWKIIKGDVNIVMNQMYMEKTISP